MEHTTEVNGYWIKVGCDPEFFIKDRKSGKLVSAHGVIPGTKKNPLKVKGGAVQVDGMALEFNIDPAGSMKEFNTNIDNVLNVLGKMTPQYEFEMVPVAEFGAPYIASQPLEARMLGCDPDYNAYTKTVNPRPNGELPFRTASGHIHVSWKKIKAGKNWPDDIDPLDPTHFEACCQLTKMMDKYLGIPSVFWDKETKRRELYGAPGCFRPKCYGGGWYGLEYRTLSNLWLNRDSTRDLVYGNTIEAIKNLFDDYEDADKGIHSIDPDTQEYREISAKEIIEKAGLQPWRNGPAIDACRGSIRAPVYYRELREKNNKVA